MDVIVSCSAKFHAFNLAEQLYKRGYLHKLLTAFYSKKRYCLLELRKDKEDIDPKKVITNIFPTFINVLLSRMPFFKTLDPEQLSNKLFDNWAKSQIDKCDILVAWSNAALRSIKRAKSYGAVTIAERGSSHILFQKEILEEEYSKYNLKTKPIKDHYVSEELILYSESDYISIPSNFAKQTYINRGIDPKKLIQIPYGVDFNNFRKIQKEDDVFRIIFAGSLSLRKGVHYLLKAFSELGLKNVELVLIGHQSKEIKPFMEKYKRCYRYIGKVPHLELYRYLSQGSIFVLPSIEEGLAMVIPQAMACGLPVICTTNTGGADIIRDGKEGFIIPIRDVSALKEKILYLYEHEEERRLMSEMSLKRAKEFTWDAYGDKVITAYKEILHSR